MKMNLASRIAIYITLMVILYNGVICWYSDLPGTKIFMVLDLIIAFLFIVGMSGEEK